MQAITTKELVTARSALNLRKAYWACSLAICGAAGIGCGVAGLLLSFLAAEGVLDPSSRVRLAVPILIVISLTSFMCFAHAMDRLQEAKERK